MFHEPVQNSCVICRVNVCQMGQDEVWRRRMAVLILCYGSHRPSDCPLRVLAAIMMLLIFCRTMNSGKHKATRGRGAIEIADMKFLLKVMVLSSVGDVDCKKKVVGE